MALTDETMGILKYDKYLWQTVSGMPEKIQQLLNICFNFMDNQTYNDFVETHHVFYLNDYVEKFRCVDIHETIEEFREAADELQKGSANYLKVLDENRAFPVFTSFDVNEKERIVTFDFSKPFVKYLEQRLMNMRDEEERC